jgi:hypothetical protein
MGRYYMFLVVPEVSLGLIDTIVLLRLECLHLKETLHIPIKRLARPLHHVDS